MQDSIWFQTVSGEDRALLGHSDPLPESADVVIVGAGMIGLLTAYYLTEAGITDICVLDRSTALAEASGANSGGLWFAQRSAELEAVPGIARASSDLYDQLASRFEFGFERCGLLQLLYDEQQIEDAAQRAELTRNDGFRVEQVSGDQAQVIEPALGFKPLAALFYPEDGHLHPVKLGLALFRYLKSQNVRFCLHTEVSSPGLRVETSRGAISAGKVVIACGSWTPLVTRVLGWEPPIKPIRGTCVAVGPLKAPPKRDIAAANFLHWRLAGEYVGGGGTADDVGFDRQADPAAAETVPRGNESAIPAACGLHDRRLVVRVPSLLRGFEARGRRCTGISKYLRRCRAFQERHRAGSCNRQDHGRSDDHWGNRSPDRRPVAREISCQVMRRAHWSPGFLVASQVSGFRIDLHHIDLHPLTP